MGDDTLDPSNVENLFPRNDSHSLLTFQLLRKINVLRCEDAFHPLGSWDLPRWANAMAGEVGEACNAVKKWDRGLPGDPQGEEAKKALAKELADVICYADLLAARAGINLGQAVVEKFNEVSVKRGSNYLLLPKE